MSCDWALRDDQLVANSIKPCKQIFIIYRLVQQQVFSSIPWVLNTLVSERYCTCKYYTPMLNFEWSSNLHLFLNPVWDGLVITHLPEGPTLHFKLSSVRLTTEIKVSDNNLFQFWLLLAEQCITEVTLICWGYIFMDFEIDLLQNQK